MCLSCLRGPWAPASCPRWNPGQFLCSPTWPWACWGTPQAPPGPSRVPPAALAEALSVCFQSEDLDFWLSTTPPPAAAAAPALSTVRAGGRAPCTGRTLSAAGNSCLLEECGDTLGCCPQRPSVTHQSSLATQAPGVGGCRGTLTQVSQLPCRRSRPGSDGASGPRGRAGSSRAQSRHRSRWARPLWALGSAVRARWPQAGLLSSLLATCTSCLLTHTWHAGGGLGLVTQRVSRHKGVLRHTGRGHCPRPRVPPRTPTTGLSAGRARSERHCQCPGGGTRGATAG